MIDKKGAEKRMVGKVEVGDGLSKECVDDPSVNDPSAILQAKALLLTLDEQEVINARYGRITRCYISECIAEKTRRGCEMWPLSLYIAECVNNLLEAVRILPDGEYWRGGAEDMNRG